MKHWVRTGVDDIRPMTPEEEEEFEERAAILEYDAGKTRTEAEALAKEMIVKQQTLNFAPR